MRSNGMRVIREYKKAESLEEAWQLNQKKSNRVLGGMVWLKMGKMQIGTAIDLSGLGLDTIEETEDEFRIGCMVTLRDLELDSGLNGYTDGAVSHRRRPVPESRDGRRKYLRKIRIFRRADDVSGDGQLCGALQRRDHSVERVRKNAV